MDATGVQPHSRLHRKCIVLSNDDIVTSLSKVTLVVPRNDTLQQMRMAKITTPFALPSSHVLAGTVEAVGRANGTGCELDYKISIV